MAMGRGEETVKCMERVTWKLTSPYVRQTANRGICCMAQETQTGAVSTQWAGMRTEMGGRFKMEGIYVYLWLIHVEV